MKKSGMAVLFLALVSAVSSVPALADSFQTFTLNGETLAGATIAGTFTLDETTGNFTSAAATASAPASLTFNSSYFGFYQSCTDYAGDCDVFIYSSSGFPALGLVCACSTFIGYEGGMLGASSDPANGWDSDIDYSNTNLDLFTSGSLTPTPEPGSLLLIGSGFVAFAGMVRRRLKA